MEPSSALTRERRSRLVTDELRRLGGDDGGGGSSASCSGSQTRARVRRLIGEELQGLLRTAAATGDSLVDLASLGRHSGNASMHAARERGEGRSSGSDLQLVRDYKFASSSAPVLPKIGPSELTRQYQGHRKENGEVYSDYPPWEVFEGTKPLVPSKHKEMSKNLWASLNPSYQEFPEHSTLRKDLKTPVVEEPTVRLFMNPKSDFGFYREEAFKIGNKLVMRKNAGGSMKKSQ